MAKIVNDWIVRAIAESSDYFDGVDHYKKTAEIILMMRSLGYSAVDTMKVLAIHVPDILFSHSNTDQHVLPKIFL